MKKLELMKGPFSPKEKIEYAEGSIVSQEFIHNLSLIHISEPTRH